MQPHQSQSNSEKQQLPPQFLDDLEGVYWEADPLTFNFTFLSGKEDKLLGYPREQWFEDSFWVNHIHPDDRDWAPQFCMQASRAHKSHRFDYRMLAADGRTVWIHDRVTILAQEGRISKVCGLLLDITEEKEVELAIKETRMQLSEAQRLTRLGYWDRDYVRNRCTLSEAARSTLGVNGVENMDDLEACERAFNDRIHPDDRQRVMDASVEALAGTKPYDIEYRLVVDNGEVRHVHSRGEVLRDHAGTPIRWFGTLQEISELRRVERELYESERRFRMCLDHASDMLMLFDSNCRIIEVNRTACAKLGYTREELLGQDPSFFSRMLTSDQSSPLQDCLASGETAEFETFHRRKDGSQFPVEVRIAPVKDCGNIGSISLANDITERQNSQRILTENHKLMRAIVNGTSDVIYAKNLAGYYLLINSAGANLFGLNVEEVLCRRDCDLPLTDAARILIQENEVDPSTGKTQLVEQEVLIGGRVCTFLSTRCSYFNSDGKAIGTIGISRDVTELKQLSDALRTSQKMEAVGRLAGGIAHDFNNLLTVIISYSELLLLSLADGDPQRHQVNEIFKCGERAATLTRQLLAFSRKQRLQPQVVNLRESLGELSKVLRPVIGEGIELAINVEEGVADVKMDLDQFHQSITNLAVNARDAMPHGGKLSIEVADFVARPPGQSGLGQSGLGQSGLGQIGLGQIGLGQVTSNQMMPHPHLNPGRYARISVSDTGIGMSDSMQARIFEPFFTTKPIGKGSGLGLSMTYGFVTQSGGHIEVSSSSGNGSIFRLYLPSASTDVQEAITKNESDDFSGQCLSSHQGKETVLLVEDEETVRALCCRILEACGYTVLQASDGLEALELLQSEAHKVDLLLSDVVMPRMNGPKLLEAIQRERPQLPVLFMSGYADEVVLREIPADKHNLLRKPFNPKQLAERVRASLKANSNQSVAGE